MLSELEIITELFPGDFYKNIGKKTKKILFIDNDKPICILT